MFTPDSSSNGDAMPHLPVFSQVKFARICVLIESHVPHVFADVPEMRGREGAYFCAFDDDGVPISTIGAGPIKREKRHKYKRISEKKAYDLALAHRVAGTTHCRQLKDDDIERYTGGYATDDGGYTVSGYTADADEVCAVVAGQLMGDHARTSELLSANPLASFAVMLLQRVEHSMK